MAILVSGGAGYIGSHTCVELLAAGYDIVVADNFYNSCPKAVERVKQISGKDFRFYEADMTKAEERLNSLMRSAKNATFGQYKFSQVINTKPELMKLNEIQDRIKAALEKDTAEYGIER